MRKVFLQMTPLRLLTQLVAVYSGYYMLLTENNAGISITHIILFAHTLPLKQHLFVMGMLPIYIGFIIFGASMLANVVSKWLEESFIPSAKDKSAKTSFNSQF